MNILLKRLLVLILLMFGFISLSFGASCCYLEDGGGSDNIEPIVAYDGGISDRQRCEGTMDGIHLGPSDDTRSNICQDYIDMRISCKPTGMASSETCANTIGGNAIYNISAVKEKLNFAQMCEPREYSETSCRSSIGSSIGSGGSGSTGSSDGSGDSSGEGEAPSEEASVGEEISGLDDYCESRGGSFLGFFANKQSCEQVEAGGNQLCIYNPSKGGILSTDLHYYSGYSGSIAPFEEPSCVPKTQIQKCSDYKTKNNCEMNKAYGEAGHKSDSPQLVDGCSWVPAQEYASTLNNLSEGMCVSNFVEENVDYNIEEFGIRRNIIKNSLFRERQTNWDTEGSLTSISYDGDQKAIRLEEGQNLSQHISNLGRHTVYRPFFQYKQLEQGNMPDMVIKALDKSGDVIKTFTPGPQDVSAQINSTFKQIDYGQVSFQENVFSINFTITAKAKSIYDAIAVASSTPSEGRISSSVFYPVELIDSKASYCGECFNSLGLNTCTKEKSDSLGACSYMVTGPQQKYESSLSDYTGKNNNVYMKSESEDFGDSVSGKWSSQSIASSRVFCEMYVTEDSCTNPNSYVNKNFAPLHLFSDNNQLCKWDSDKGCFKDSNNNGRFDVKNGVIEPSIASTEQEIKYEMGYKYNTFSKDGEPTASDFVKACDTIPPIVNSYVEGKNSSGDIIRIEDSSYNGLIGNVTLNIKVHDVFPDNYACAPYAGSGEDEVSKKTYILFSKEDSFTQERLNGGTGYKSFDFKEIFESLQNEADISYKVFDQSGNLGVNRSLEEFNVDLISPALKPEFRASFIRGGSGTVDKGISQNAYIGVENYLTKNSTLNFSLTDKGGVDSCSYSFRSATGLNGDGENLEEKFIPKINFEGNEEESFMINLSEHINNVKTTGGGGEIKINCRDIFGQTTTHIYTFRITGDLYVHKPTPIQPFFDPENYSSENIFVVSEGFYNTSNHNVEVFISRDDISSCRFGRKGLDLNRSGSFEISGVEGYFETKAYGNVDFSNSQNSQIDKRIVCQSDTGTQITGNVTYFIEDTSPEITSMELVNVENSTYYDQNQEVWYSIRDPSNTRIRFDIDGTGSWIKNKYDLYLGGEVKNEDKSYDFMNYFNYSNGHNFVSEGVEIHGVDNIAPQATNNRGVALIQDNVQQYDFNITIEDKAENLQNQSFSYRYDNSSPSLKFGGDIISQNNDRNNPRLYTSKEDPQINLTFNTPDYRTYKCDITINEEEETYNYELGSPGSSYSSSYSFTLSNILGKGSFDVSDRNEDITFSLNCTGQVYGESVTHSNKSYSFVYDNTAPILNNVSFREGNTRYYGNANSLVLDSIVDDLEYEFNDTNEEEYTCEYKFEKSSYYNCNTSIKSRNFGERITQAIEDISILTEYSGQDWYQRNPSFSCYQRNEEFWGKYENARANNESFETTINVTTQCEDAVGLKTQNKTAHLDVVYVPNDIGPVEFNFENGKAKPIITMLSSRIEGLEYQFTYKGEEVFSKQEGDVSNNDDYYEVTFGESGIDTSEFLEGKHKLQLKVYGGGDNRVIAKKDGIILQIDTQAPTANLTILDNIGGEVDSEEFKIDFSTKDEGSSGINSVKLNMYVEGEKYNLYSKEDGINSRVSYSHNDPYIRKNTHKEFKGSYFFSGENGSTYNFELVVKDSMGNTNRTNITTQIVNDFQFEVKDSQNVKLSIDPYKLLTRSSEELKIAGRVSESSRCSINPYVENEMEPSEGEKLAELGEEFTFNLGEIGFSMDNAKTNTIILRFECSNDKGSYNFRRELTKISGLPDYTLQSSNGFYFNSLDSSDYHTQLTIKSVGPFKQIRCDYGIGEKSNSTNIGRSFVKDINLEESSAEKIELICEDPFGVEGPNKEYDLVVVTDNTSIEIGNVSLSSNNYEKTLNEEGEFDITGNKNYELSFEVNKKGIECSYNFLSSRGIPGRVASFFQGLFNIGAISIQESDTPYVYRITQLNFQQDRNLKISCSSDSISASKTFDLNFIEDEEAQLNLS